MVPLAVEGISVSFGGVQALRDVQLTVDRGEICGLIGPNGAGKTTLFDVISGVRVPQHGRVLLDGADVTDRSPVWRARTGLRRTFQQTQVFGWLSVVDNVVAGLEWEGGGGGLVADLVASPTRRRRERERRRVAAEALARCGLAALADVPAGTLPIGAARLVELARAIAGGPRVLLLDEPTSGLDAAESSRLAAQVTALAHADGCAVLVVEHDVGFVMSLCDRIVALHVGEVIAQGTPREIQADERVRAAYLG